MKTTRSIYVLMCLAASMCVAGCFSICASKQPGGPVQISGSGAATLPSSGNVNP